MDSNPDPTVDSPTSRQATQIVDSGNYSLNQLKDIADSWKRSWRLVVEDLKKQQAHVRQAKQRWHEADMQYKVIKQQRGLSDKREL